MKSPSQRGSADRGEVFFERPYSGRMLSGCQIESPDQCGPAGAKLELRRMMSTESAHGAYSGRRRSECQ